MTFFLITFVPSLPLSLSLSLRPSLFFFTVAVNAPVSKLVACGTAAASLLAHVMRAHHAVALTPRGLNRGELWRLLTSNLVFTSPGEALFGMYLLYHFRVFERQRGSAKYGVFALVCAAMSTGLQAAVILPLASASAIGRHRLGREPLASGPHAFVFAHFVPYFFDIPRTYHFTVCGVRLSNKVFVYLAGAQLAWSHGWRSAIPAACGLLVSAAFHSGAMGRIDRLAPPTALRRVVRATVGRALGVADQQRPLVRMRPSPNGAGGRGGAGAGGGLAGGGAGGGGGGRGDGGFGGGGLGGLGGGGGGGEGGFRAGGAMMTEAPSGPPPPGAVETLTSMGFDEGSARRALIMGDNNLAVATNILLESGAQ